MIDVNIQKPNLKLIIDGPEAEALIRWIGVTSQADMTDQGMTNEEAELICAIYLATSRDPGFINLDCSKIRR